MDNVPPPDKLRYFTLLFSAATIGCMMVATILEAPIFGSYMVPAIVALIYCVIPEDMRTQWSMHNVGYILLYIFFGFWAISSFWVIYYFISTIIHFTFSIGWIFFFIGEGFFVLDNLACFFLFYSYRKNAAVGGAPLMGNQA